MVIFSVVLLGLGVVVTAAIDSVVPLIFTVIITLGLGIQAAVEGW